MRVIDVDGHFHEPVDWLAVSRPELAAELPPPPRFMETLSTAQRAMAASLPEDFPVPEDPLDFMTAEFRAHCEKADALQPDHYNPEHHDVMYRGDARVALCDDVGIDVQWLSPTFEFGVVVQAMMTGRADLVPRLRAAWNSWAAEQVEGFSERLQPITQVDVNDVDWTIAEMTRMRQAGSRAFHVDQHPTKSLTHPDYEPMWAAAEDLGMAVYVHVMFGQAPRHPSWVNNGRGVKAFQEGPGTADEMRAETRRFLSAMVFDGVFERHPGLRVVLAETGISWLPSYLQEIDFKTTTTGMDGLAQDNFYRLPLRPSEYIQRHVRVSTLIGYIESGLDYLPLTEVFERLPTPDLLVFSSDYPHVEGRADAVRRFEQYLPADPAIRERFYGASMEDFLVGI